MTVHSWRSVVAIAAKHGAKYPELVAAQWALESQWGLEPSGTHNYFGLKGKGSSVRTTEVIEGRTVVVYDEFIDFDSLDESVEYLVNRWYKDYREYIGVNSAPDRNAAAHKLQMESYATDPYYAEKLIKLMDENHQVKEVTGENEVKLSEAAKFYNGQPHQIKAWDILQAATDPTTLEIFQHVYRGGSFDALDAVTEFPLGAPYFYQRNSNTGHGERMCQSSCIAMVLEYFWPNIVDGDDDVWLQEVLKYGDTVAQSAQLEALEAMGVDNVKFMMNGCENDLLSVLDEGCPVPIGILHKGPIKSPTGGGHWVTLIGYDDDSFFVHDPFGELDVVNGDYIETHPVAGCFQKYSRDNLMKRWLVHNSSDGWYYDFSGAVLNT